MDLPNGKIDEQRLEALFRALRQACPDPEASANFMPQLWQRIEARQKFSFFFGRVAGGLVTAAVALSLAMGVYLFVPHTYNSAFYTESYVEALANGHAAENQDFYEPIHLDVDSGIVNEL